MMNKKIILVSFVLLMLLIGYMPITISSNINYFVPDLVYSPTSYDFGSVEEGETYQTNFEIWNRGTDILTWNLGIVHPWISPNPNSGSSTGEHDVVTVTIDTTGLSVGSHSGFVSISANDGGDLRYFMIDIYVNNPPTIPSKPSGPTEVDEGVSYLYTTASTDPEGHDIKYGFDFNNDDIIESSHWTSYISSGATCNMWITFYGAVTRYIRVKAEDIYGAQSDFSLPLTVSVYGSNSPPNTPNTPSGPSFGLIGVSNYFSTSSIDSNNDNVKYGWDWDGDGNVDEWTAFYSSGLMITSSHTWMSVGIYNIQVKAEDVHGSQSGFSPFKTIVISESNNPPFKPTISGPLSGKAGNSYTYYFLTTDIDNDQVYYWIDWDDDSNSGWIGPFDSGLSISKSHIWTANGTYAIRVKSKDINGAESPWSDPLIISMPKSKSINQITTWICRLIDKLQIIKWF